MVKETNSLLSRYKNSHSPIRAYNKSSQF